MSKRIVDINTYWPTIVRDTEQFGQIAVAENEEFNRLSECIFRALEDSFIESATEYGVKRWESMLQIAPSASDTLADRKARILTYLNLKLPYTWRVLKQLIAGVVGADKVALDFINDETKLVVHGDRLSDEKWQTLNNLIDRVVPMNIIIERYNHNMEISWRDINKYAKCTTLAEMAAVNPDYANDLTSEGEWIYPLTNMVDMHCRADGLGWRGNKNIKKWSVNLPNATNVNCLFKGSSLEHFIGDMPKVDGHGYAQVFSDWGKAHFKSFKGSLQSLKNGGQFFWTGDNMTVFDSSLPSLTSGSLMFTRAILNKQSALNVLTSIPKYTSGSHPLTIGIHVDHQTDDEVLAAIEDAEAKGWTLTIQWNGTPTSGIATQDLDDIYAKVTESEYGDYTDENGNRCTLDWGHYVTDSSEYKLFYALVEAEQYYKLTKIEGIENE